MLACLLACLVLPKCIFWVMLYVGFSCKENECTFISFLQAAFSSILLFFFPVSLLLLLFTTYVGTRSVQVSSPHYDPSSRQPFFEQVSDSVRLSPTYPLFYFILSSWVGRIE